jgi:DNA-binding CsgD family transcriptional regulator
MSEIGDRILLLHAQGLPSLEIAHRLEVAQSTVHFHLRKQAERHRDRVEPQGRTVRRPARGVTKSLVSQLLESGLTRVEVARRLGLAKSTVSYHARQLGETMDARFAQRFDWSLIQAYYDLGHSIRECRHVFGFSMSAWDNAVRRGVVTPRPRFRPLDEAFVANSRRNRGSLKARLISSGLRQARCERCGISEWLGRPLSVALHHVNGDRLDNRVENLELLCPNCHSQTDTFGGRNLRLVRDASRAVPGDEAA